MQHDCASLKRLITLVSGASIAHELRKPMGAARTHASAAVRWLEKKLHLINGDTFARHRWRYAAFQTSKKGAKFKKI
jgi:C4-dicarboxylate-specific signal transduction histidine kinase